MLETFREGSAARGSVSGGYGAYGLWFGSYYLFKPGNSVQVFDAQETDHHRVREPERDIVRPAAGKEQHHHRQEEIRQERRQGIGMAAYFADDVQEHEKVEARKKDEPENPVIYPRFK